MKLKDVIAKISFDHMPIGTIVQRMNDKEFFGKTTLAVVSKCNLRHKTISLCGFSGYYIPEYFRVVGTIKSNI